jgi:oligoribonuclease NrnB/cAMP/cGMP phosphodiesterase (DHH superfamily)
MFTNFIFNGEQYKILSKISKSSDTHDVAINGRLLIIFLNVASEVAERTKREQWHSEKAPGMRLEILDHHKTPRFISYCEKKLHFYDIFFVFLGA